MFVACAASARADDGAPAKSPPAEVFVIGNLQPLGVVNNQYAHGFAQQLSGGIWTGASVPILGQTVVLEWEYKDTAYRHDAGDVATIGHGQTFVPSFVNHEYVLEERAGVRIPGTPLDVGFAVHYHPSSSGFPIVVGGGLGVGKMPDTHRTSSIYGKLYYYPYVLNEFPYHDRRTGQDFPLQYAYARYELGVARTVGHAFGGGRILVTAGISGEHATAIVNAPSNVDITSLNIGLGVGF